MSLQHLTPGGRRAWWVEVWSGRLRGGEPGPTEFGVDDGDGGVDGFFEGHVCRVEEDGVGSGLERRIGAVAVALVAGAQVADDRIRLKGVSVAGLAKLIEAAL